ncbi:MAG: TetR family transcriptional regulator C-terminal domain-containing protein [Ignavibacteriaceae bacterium]|jgi:TetR/AcrR family transcriptional repressor of nem operon
MSHTKEKILSAGARLVREKGFNHTGLHEVLKEAGVPKGSFYFHFENKESFGLALLDVYISFFETEMNRIMLDKSKSGLVRLKGFLDFFKRTLMKEQFIGGCPLGNLAQEMGDINEKFRKKIALGLEKIESKILGCLQDSQDAGEIPDSIDTNSAAAFILNSWEGAIVRVKVEKSIQPLELLDDFIFNKILK